MSMSISEEVAVFFFRV